MFGGSGLSTPFYSSTSPWSCFGSSSTSRPGSDDWWFYWPTLGAGVIVAIIGLSMFGVSGLFGGDWQRREEEK
jgi:2TM domain